MKLEIIDAASETSRLHEFPDRHTVIVGRGVDCDLRLDDPEASRTHAQLALNDGQWFVTDLDSRNGTWLNGHAVAERAVYADDRIQVGNTVLALHDIPPRPLPSRTAVEFDDQDKSVLVTMHHEEADMLRFRTAGETLPEILRENEVLREICRVSQVMAGKEDAQVILESILNQIREILNADTVCVLSRDDDAEDWTIRAAAGGADASGAINVSGAIVQGALDEEAAILSSDPLSDSRFDPSQSIVTQGVSSAMCSPMKVGERFGGILFIDRRKRRLPFNELDLRMAATVANLLGIFLEKEQYELEMQRKARLAVIGEVIAGLAHYVKNVVGSFRFAISNLEMAVSRQRPDLVSQCTKTIGSIERRISDLMLNMLSFAKDRKPARSDVDIPKLLEELVAPYRTRLEEGGIALSVDCDPDATPVHADEQALFRAFLNLFLNSIDSLESKDGEDPKQIRISATREANEIVFRLTDTGKGIEEDVRKSIFTAFFSTKGSRGTGLGLAVVQKIVEEHGGRIRVDSEPGEWTTFTITLPHAPGTSAPSETDSAH